MGPVIKFPFILSMFFKGSVTKKLFKKTISKMILLVFTKFLGECWCKNIYIFLNNWQFYSFANSFIKTPKWYFSFNNIFNNNKNRFIWIICWFSVDCVAAAKLL